MQRGPPGICCLVEWIQRRPAGYAAWHRKCKGIKKADKYWGGRFIFTCCYSLDVYQISQSLVLLHTSLLSLIDTDTIIWRQWWLLPLLLSKFTGLNNIVPIRFTCSFPRHMGPPAVLWPWLFHSTYIFLKWEQNFLIHGSTLEAAPLELGSPAANQLCYFHLWPIHDPAFSWIRKWSMVFQRDRGGPAGILIPW